MAQITQKEKLILLELLKESLLKPCENEKKTEYELTPGEWENLIETAERHAVLSLLYDQLKSCNDLKDVLWKKTELISRQTVQKSYRLLFLNKYVTDLLKEQNIQAITLKGAVTASLYAQPELRKSGDVDILITNEADHEKACRILEEHGFIIKEDQKTLHHVELENKENISVELHGLLAEPFESQVVNDYLRQLLPEYEKNCQINRYWGFELLEPTKAYHAFYLILHMLQHFLRAGFGLKNLCDWVVFWNLEIKQEEKDRFVELIKKSGTDGFVRVLTATCVKYLGLNPQNVSCFMTVDVPDTEIEAFLDEIFEAEEFGKSANNRMVAMRDTGMLAYAKEFHHQMQLNYPKSSRMPLFWPFLWCATLFRFLYNNRKIRKTSGLAILKKAGNRSRLVKNMQLFESKDESV